MYQSVITLVHVTKILEKTFKISIFQFCFDHDIFHFELNKSSSKWVYITYLTSNTHLRLTSITYSLKLFYKATLHSRYKRYCLNYRGNTCAIIRNTTTILQHKPGSNLFIKPHKNLKHASYQCVEKTKHWLCCCNLSQVLRLSKIETTTHRCYYRTTSQLTLLKAISRQDKELIPV